VFMTYILFKFFNEIEAELVAHFVNFIKEGVNHVVLDFELREFLLVSLLAGLGAKTLGARDVGRDLLLEDVSDGLVADLVSGAIGKTVVECTAEVVICRVGRTSLGNSKVLGI